MIVVMKEGASEGQVRRAIGLIVESGLDVHRSTGVHRVILGVVGDLRHVPLRRLERMPGVDKIVFISTKPESMRMGRPWRGAPLTIAVVGLGQMGGSLAMVLKRNTPHHIIGFQRKIKEARLCMEAVHERTTDFRRACGADAVVFATPVGATIRYLQTWARHAKPGSLWMDMGSVKVPVCEAACRRMPHHATFIGGHPLAGSEKQGLAAASPDLFGGKIFVLCPATRNAGSAAKLRLARHLVASLGASPFVMDAARHDRVLAYTSHLPQLVSSALAATAGGTADTALSGNGFRDLTRLADSPLAMWQDIATHNRRNIRRALKDFQKTLSCIETLSPQSLEALFRKASRARRSLSRR
jgi:prephenate dehydrogenase